MYKSSAITFQLATQYLSKITLRMERLFLAIEKACIEQDPIIHHYALKNIIEIIKLIEKPELKSRFIKEFMRIEHVANKSTLPLPAATQHNLQIQIQQLTQIAGRFGEAIHRDPFLQSIRIAQSAHTSDCELHAPQLYLWLEDNAMRRKKELNGWMCQLSTLYNVVGLYMTILRDTALFKPIDMIHGYYQQSISPQPTTHLVLLRMDKRDGLVPLMQLGHHGLTLRLCDSATMQEVNHPQTFAELAICQF
jgi:cell division protein ZapD